MRTGGLKTLTEVVEFYTRGAEFHDENIDNLGPHISGISELRGNPELRSFELRTGADRSMLTIIDMDWAP